MADVLSIDQVDDTAPVPAQLGALRRDVRALAGAVQQLAEEVRTLGSLVADLGVRDMSKPERQALPAVVRGALERKQLLIAITRIAAIAGGAVTVMQQVFHR